VFSTLTTNFIFKIKVVYTIFQLPLIICLTSTLPFTRTKQMPPKKKPLPLHVSLYRIEEERKNVVLRTQTRLAKLRATSMPVHQITTTISNGVIYTEPREQLPVNDAPMPGPGYIGFCVGILLTLTIVLALVQAHNVICSSTSFYSSIVFIIQSQYAI
jgi:hypothetical protein